MTGTRTAAVVASFFIVMSIFICSDALFVCNENHGRFQCPGGRCITLRQKCDFRKDCRGGEDERNCSSTYRECNTTTEFKCNNTKCIYIEWKCDGHNDCFDNSDEHDTLCDGQHCSETMFLCHKSGECVSRNYVCDGDIDCDDGEDEENCPTPTCDADEKLCANGKECQPKDYFCDGEADCLDKSDEKNCTECRANEFKCKDGSGCLPESDRCDTLADCADRSDEENCPSDHVNKCPPNFFACRSGLCLPETFQCNGEIDCPDRSDEIGCCYFKPTCPSGERLCANRWQCINSSLWCDGARDCIDKSDESGCPGGVIPDKSCHRDTYFRCKDGNCIDEKKVCNSVPDCSDGDDEPEQCNHNECMIANGNCSHGCGDLKIGYLCLCPTGYRLKEDKLSCEDIDECGTLDNTCEERCINTEGSFRCLGHDILPTVRFMVGDSDKIVNMTVQRHESSNVLLGKISVSSVAVDSRNQYVYWSDARSEIISRTKTTDPTKTEVLVRKGLVKNPSSLSYDWVHGLLYWVDTSPPSVSVLSVNKPNRPKTLMRARDYEYLSVAVHPKYGYLYVGSLKPPHQGKVERCGLNGRNCTTLFDHQVGLPVDIAIDYEYDHLYWIDEQYKYISISHLDGSNHRNVDLGASIPTSLAVFGRRVFIIDDETRRILSTNRKGGDVKTIKAGLSLAADLEIYEEGSQIEGSNQCSNDRCPGLCLPTASSDPYTGYTCLCPDGFFISNTNTCEPMTTTSSPTTSALNTIISRVTTTTKNTAAVVTNETTSAGASTTSSIAILVIGLLALVILIVGVVCLLFRYRKQRFARMSMNFNNPIYKKMGERPPSRSSFPGLNEPSPSTSSGDVSNHSNDGTAALVLNEEPPDIRKPTPIISGVKIISDGRYTMIPNDDISGNLGDG